MIPSSHSRNQVSITKKASTAKAHKTQSKLPILLFDSFANNFQTTQTTTHKQFTLNIKSTHLFDTVNTLEKQNRIKAAILEHTLLQLMERAGELWQIRNKSILVKNYDRADSTDIDSIKMKIIMRRSQLMGQ